MLRNNLILIIMLIIPFSIHAMDQGSNDQSKALQEEQARKRFAYEAAAVSNNNNVITSSSAGIASLRQLAFERIKKFVEQEAGIQEFVETMQSCDMSPLPVDMVPQINKTLIKASVPFVRIHNWAYMLQTPRQLQFQMFRKAINDKMYKLMTYSYFEPESIFDYQKVINLKSKSGHELAAHFDAKLRLLQLYQRLDYFCIGNHDTDSQQYQNNANDVCVLDYVPAFRSKDVQGNIHAGLVDVRGKSFIDAFAKLLYQLSTKKHKNGLCTKCIGATYLHRAVTSGNKSLMERLLQLDAEMTDKKNKEIQELNSKQPDQAQPLVRRKIDLNFVPDHRGYTPLHYVDTYATEEMAKLLVAHGAKHSIYSPYMKLTPLGVVLLTKKHGSQDLKECPARVEELKKMADYFKSLPTTYKDETALKRIRYYYLRSKNASSSPTIPKAGEYPILEYHYPNLNLQEYVTALNIDSDEEGLDDMDYESDDDMDISLESVNALTTPEADEITYYL